MNITIDDITFQIPEWALVENQIHLFSGIERFAVLTRKTDGIHVEVKTVRCNKCGQCCRVACPHKDWSNGLGGCIYLENDKCSLGFAKPFSCCVHRPRGLPICTIKYEEVGVIKHGS